MKGSQSIVPGWHIWHKTFYNWTAANQDIAEYEMNIYQQKKCTVVNNYCTLYDPSLCACHDP